MKESFQYSLVSFKLSKEIGQEGKNSKVFLGHDNHLDCEIAVKRVDLDKEKKEDFDKYFLEARTLYLSSHPNVVQILYASFDDYYVYLVMPFYKNGSLKKLIGERCLTNREIIKYSIELLNGLHNIHSKRLIHFDIKPDNIMISDRNEALLSDFGLTKVVNPMTGVAQPQQFYPRALPPEVLKGEREFDRTYDIYQVGLTIYRMCVGDKEYYAQFNQFISEKILDPSKLLEAQKKGEFPNRDVYPAHIPKKIKMVIKKCLQFEPSKRYSSAIDIANDLAGIDGNILDWDYSSDGKCEYWKKIDSMNRAFELTVSLDSRESKAIKIINGNTTNITSYNSKSITDQKILDFLEKY